MNRTAEYAAEIATFQEKLWLGLSAIIAIVALFIILDLVADWLDRAERKYRVKHHIRGPRDD